MVGFCCCILPVLFFIVSQYANVRQISSGTNFFSHALPSPEVFRSNNFQSMLSFKIPEKVERGTKLESQVLHWAGGMWKVTLYPCGKSSPICRTNATDGFAAIYLELLKAGDCCPKDVMFSFSLLSTDRKDVNEGQNCTQGHNFRHCHISGFETFVEEEYFTEHALQCLNSEGKVCVLISLQDNTAATAVAPPIPPPRGLRNLGCTCYMNAILQAHFHADIWKDALLSSDESKPPSITWALRKIFIALSSSAEPTPAPGGIETNSLVKILGIDPTVQQDAQEFGCTLLQEVESEARGQGWSKVIEGRKAAFEGRLENYIECVNHKLAEKRWQEKFFDLSMDVKGYSDLNESMEALLSSELMTGENKWKTEEYGYQEARKGIRLISLPRILQFHLKRFEFDPKTQTMEKVNSRFTFPTEMDMGLWCNDSVGDCNENDNKPPADHGINSLQYSLRSIVMHQGGLDKGHYYTYIQRKGQDNERRWYKLDDNRASSVEESEVLDDAFGHEQKKMGGLLPLRNSVWPMGIVQRHSRASTIRGDCNAYILQYHLNRSEGTEQCSIKYPNFHVCRSLEIHTCRD